MTPYFSEDGITIYHGDCLDVLPELGDFAPDCCVTDPPYGETSLAWDRWPDGWPALVALSLKAGGSLWCFGSVRMFLARSSEFSDWRFAQDVVWEKHNGSGFHADRFKRVHENALQWYRRADQWADVYKSPVYTNDATRRIVRRNGRPPHMGEIEGSTYVSHDGGPRLARSVLQVRSCHGHAEHPTQKPHGILWPLIEYSCPPGGLVLDLFAGSGSTLLAARKTGRRAVGVEISERDCEIAARRLAQRELFTTEGAA